MSDFRGTERPFLYIMVFFTFLNSCDTDEAVKRIEKNYCKAPVVEWVTNKDIEEK